MRRGGWLSRTIQHPPGNEHVEQSVKTPCPFTLNHFLSIFGSAISVPTNHQYKSRPIVVMGQFYISRWWPWQLSHVTLIVPPYKFVPDIISRQRALIIKMLMRSYCNQIARSLVMFPITFTAQSDHMETYGPL